MWIHSVFFHRALTYTRYSMSMINLLITLNTWVHHYASRILLGNVWCSRSSYHSQVLSFLQQCGFCYIKVEDYREGMQKVTHTHIYIYVFQLNTSVQKESNQKKVDAWIMGKKTSVKLTHSTVYIPWVEKKGFFWNDFSFHFSVPPPKRIGMYMKVGPDSTRRTCKRSLHKLYSTENSVEVNMPACCCILTTVFSLIRFKFCTKFRVCKH